MNGKLNLGNVHAQNNINHPIIQSQLLSFPASETGDVAVARSLSGSSLTIQQWRRTLDVWQLIDVTVAVRVYFVSCLHVCWIVGIDLCVYYACVCVCFWVCVCVSIHRRVCVCAFFLFVLAGSSFSSLDPAFPAVECLMLWLSTYCFDYIY